MSELPPIPDADEVGRAAAVVIAGHQGDAEAARRALTDEVPAIRVAAIGALARCGALTAEHLQACFGDPAPSVRARAAELAITSDDIDPSPLLNDVDHRVVEVACFACGEVRWPDDSAPVTTLSHIATTHDDPLCREAAAAALGAIGDEGGLDAVLAACGDRVTVRRRAVLALAAFDDPRADDALTAALDDRDWQVRQAAEDLLEVGRSLDGDPDPDAYADDAGSNET